MQLSIDNSLSSVLDLISRMSLDEIEKVKSKIVERELYFKKFKKDNIKNIINDFENDGYSEDFLRDLEQGLKKSSVYNED